MQAMTMTAEEATELEAELNALKIFQERENFCVGSQSENEPGADLSLIFPDVRERNNAFDLMPAAIA